MRRNIVCCAMVVAIASVVAVAAAWCPEKGNDNKAAQAVSAETRAGQGADHSIHVCDGASCDHRCTAKGGRVIRVADKALLNLIHEAEPLLR